MDGLCQGGRFSFFALFHLGNQKVHGLGGDLVNPLAYGTKRDNGFRGDGGIIEAYDPVGVRQMAVFADDQVQEDVCMGVIGEEDALFSLGYFSSSVVRISPS